MNHLRLQLCARTLASCVRWKLKSVFWRFSNSTLFASEKITNNAILNYYTYALNIGDRPPL